MRISVLPLLPLFATYLAAYLLPRMLWHRDPIFTYDDLNPPTGSAPPDCQNRSIVEYKTLESGVVATHFMCHDRVEPEPEIDERASPSVDYVCPSGV
jgi:hypothetical protein